MYLYSLRKPDAVLKATNVLLLLMFCFQGIAGGNKSDTLHHQAPIVRRMMELYHCNPRPLDDNLCTDVLHDFLFELDPAHMYFTDSDLKRLNDKNELKKELLGTSPEFLDKVSVLYRKQLIRADSIVSGVLRQPFDFEKDDSVNLSADSNTYAANETELKNRWYKWLKYETLERLADIKYYDSTATRDYILRKQQEQLQVVNKVEQRRIKNILGHPWGYENYIASVFCNALTMAYDPHSEFFPLAAKENFIGALNGNAYSFGMELNENDKGEVEIVHLTPGSPAWKCGQLSRNDVLAEIEWEGKPPVDLAGAGVEEVSDMLAGENHHRLKLTVHKANGQQVTVQLEKEIVQNDEDLAKSFVLEGSRKIGYVLLPAFYSAWEAKNGNSCTDDVAREVAKLKTEGMQGLILDLRFNGGGSMDEAVALAGLFIDEGTLGFARYRDEKPMPLKDPSRGTIYDGPMLVLVNGETASAAEFVAAALQDYNRAVIVGTPTFGKGSMQEVLPADTLMDFSKISPEKIDDSKYDFVKITTGKLYRVTGCSNQIKGVQPDIILPDVFENFEDHENIYPHTLVADSVKRAGFYKKLPALPISQLAEKSSMRLNTNSSFVKVNECNNLFREMKVEKGGVIDLQFDVFLAQAKKFNNGTRDLLNTIEADSSRSYKIDNTTEDKQKIASNAFEAEINIDFLKYLQHDIYIDETFYILSDYIELKSDR